jgi:hypothetical protein
MCHESAHRQLRKLYRERKLSLPVLIDQGMVAYPKGHKRPLVRPTTLGLLRSAEARTAHQWARRDLLRKAGDQPTPNPSVPR